MMGCAYGASGTECIVYIPNNVPPQLEAAILAHELGHCNGWNHAQDLYHAIAVSKAKENPVCQQVPKPEACP